MLKLKSNIRNALRKRARNLMKNVTKDMMHDIFHIERTLKIARQLYNSINNKNINWDLIEQAVLWHDVSRINNYGSGLFMFYFDDLFSIRIIKKEFNKLNVNSKFTKAVCKLIIENKKYYPIKRTIEGRIFKEADILDMYSVERFERAKLYIINQLSRFPKYKKKIYQFGINLYAYLSLYIFHPIIIKQLSLKKSLEIYNNQLKKLVKFFNENKAYANMILNKTIQRKIIKELNRG